VEAMYLHRLSLASNRNPFSSRNVRLGLLQRFKLG
jgi:hypothetical protein